MPDAVVMLIEQALPDFWFGSQITQRFLSQIFLEYDRIWILIERERLQYAASQVHQKNARFEQPVIQSLGHVEPSSTKTGKKGHDEKINPESKFTCR